MDLNLCNRCAFSDTVDQRGAQPIGAMRCRIGTSGCELLEISRASGRIFLLQSLLVRNGLLLNVFDVQGSAISIVRIKNVCCCFVAKDTTQQARQFECVMDTEVEAKAAKRIVDVRGVASKKHSSSTKTRRYPLMGLVNLTVDYFVAPVLGDQALQSPFDCHVVEEFRGRLIESGR